MHTFHRVEWCFPGPTCHVVLNYICLGASAEACSALCSLIYEALLCGMRPALYGQNSLYLDELLCCVLFGFQVVVAILLFTLRTWRPTQGLQNSGCKDDNHAFLFVRMAFDRVSSVCFGPGTPSPRMFKFSASC